jgi:hypothetical protein
MVQLIGFRAQERNKFIFLREPLRPAYLCLSMMARGKGRAIAYNDGPNCAGLRRAGLCAGLVKPHSGEYFTKLQKGLEEGVSLPQHGRILSPICVSLFCRFPIVHLQIRSRIKALDPLMRDLCEQTCPYCTDNFCRRATVWFDFTEFFL